MNKYFDDSRLEEKIIDIILPLEIIYKEEKGDSVAPQLRHGRLNEDLYPNRKVINTRYGLTPIIPQVKVYFRAFTDGDSIITVDIFNADEKSLFKKFVIKSKNNDYEIENMKNICDEIKDILTAEVEVVEAETNDETENTEIKYGKVVQLIEHIRNIEDLIFEEIAQ